MSAEPFLDLCFSDWLRLQQSIQSIKNDYLSLNPQSGTAWLPSDIYDKPLFLECIRTQLIPLASKTVYTIRIEQEEPNFQGETSWYAHLCLSRGEAQAYRAYLLEADFAQKRKTVACSHVRKVMIEPITLSDLIEQSEHLKSFAYRLNHVTPYRDRQVASNPEWVWVISGGEHWNLLMDKGAVIKPDGWEVSSNQYGKIRSTYELIKITNAEGLSGLMNIKGEVIVSCEWGYLSDPIQLWAEKGYFIERAREIGACNAELFDSKGDAVNPSTVKVIAKSESEGIWKVSSVAHQNNKPLIGYMNCKGDLLGDIKWRDGRGFNEGAVAVQNVIDGTWGYIDKLGDIKVQPCYLSAGSFNRGSAIVQTDEGYGVINSYGESILKPQWRRISWLNRDHFVIEAMDKKVAIANQQGVTVLPLNEVDHDLSLDIELQNLPAFLQGEPVQPARRGTLFSLSDQAPGRRDIAGCHRASDREMGHVSKFDSRAVRGHAHRFQGHAPGGRQHRPSVSATVRPPAERHGFRVRQRLGTVDAANAAPAQFERRSEQDQRQSVGPEAAGGAQGRRAVARRDVPDRAFASPQRPGKAKGPGVFEPGRQGRCRSSQEGSR